MRYIITALFVSALLVSNYTYAALFDVSSTKIIALPELDEIEIMKESGLTIVERYEVDNGHGFYVQKLPDAAIEFRSDLDSPRINLALRMFPEAGNEAKNAAAQAMIKKLVSVITGTDGQFIDEAVAGNVKLGKHIINGLRVNIVDSGNLWFLFTVYRE